MRRERVKEEKVKVRKTAPKAKEGAPKRCPGRPRKNALPVATKRAVRRRRPSAPRQAVLS